jgi:hypothetical protein
VQFTLRWSDVTLGTDGRHRTAIACGLGWTFSCVIPPACRVEDKQLPMSKQHHLPPTTLRTRSRDLFPSLRNILLLLSRVSRIDTYTIHTNTIPTPSHVHLSYHHTPPAQSSHIPTLATDPSTLSHGAEINETSIGYYRTPSYKEDCI